MAGERDPSANEQAVKTTYKIGFVIADVSVRFFVDLGCTPKCLYCN